MRFPDHGPPRVHQALLRGLLSGSLVGRTMWGDLEEEHRARVSRSGRRDADAWFRSQARRLVVREIRERLTTRPAWRKRRRSVSLERSGNRFAGPNPLASLWQDARYALRSVVVYRRRSVAAIALLALAIGIATAMFTVVDALVLRPVPFENLDRLARLHLLDEQGHGGFGVAPEVFGAWRESVAFEAVEAARGTTALLAFQGGEVNRVVASVTPGIFDLLGGVRPLRGRLFGPTEGRAGSRDHILISEDLWRSLYRADPSIVGRTLTVDGQPAVVVGILPSTFRFPNADTVVWRADDFSGTDGRPPAVYVRFAPDVPREDALELATRVAREAGAGDELRALPRPLGTRLGDYYERVIRMLAGGVVLLFVVLCSNAAALLLGGLTSRAHELSTRTALGAPRGRLIRQALIESTMLGAAGAAAGAGFGGVIVWALRSFLPQAAFVSSLNRPDIDVRALAAATAAGFAATLAVGLLSAVSGTRADVSRLLQTAGHATPTARARLATRALLVCQVALSCTLVFGAALLVRSFVNLVNEDRGLDVRNVLTAYVGFPGGLFTTTASRRSAARAVEDAVRAVPGVTAVSWSYGTPPRAAVYGGVWVSDMPDVQPLAELVSSFTVDGSFFDLYRVSILRGRAFQPTDEPAAVLVSERFAEALWPEQDPLGRRFTFDGSAPFAGTEFRVIGLVSELHYPSIEGTIDGPEIYLPFNEPGPDVYAALSFRCAGGCPDPARLRPRLRAAQPGVNVLDVEPPESAYLRQFERPRSVATLASTFAAIALIAAAAGLFSLFSQSVARRRRELGIRTALGATPVHLRRLVWNEGVTVALTGIALGAVTSFLLTRVLSSLLLDVTTTDPLSWAIVAATLTIAIAAAAWHPARSAARAAPVTLLRDP